MSIARGSHEKPLTGRDAIDRGIARGCVATVYLARDVRHGLNVAFTALRKGA